MIDWMQKHKKWLVITIWISAIAFVGGGMVGWGQYDFSLTKDSVAKVGKIEISTNDFRRAYSQEFEDMFERNNGNFDEVKAKEIGLENIVLERLIMDALLKNYALDLGLRVSDQEVIKSLKEMKEFNGEDESFSKEVYEDILKKNRIKKTDFEENIRKYLLTQKIVRLLNMELKTNDLEVDTLKGALSFSDEVEFFRIKKSDIKVELTDKEVEDFYKQVKDEYKTNAVYKVSLLESKLDSMQVSEDEIINKCNALGKSNEECQDYELKKEIKQNIQKDKNKEEALKEFVLFKKNQSKLAKELTLSLDSGELPNEVIEVISKLKINEMNKKPIELENGDYVSFKLLSKTDSKAKEFNEVKEIIKARLKSKKQQEELVKLAKEKLPNFKGELIKIHRLDFDKQIFGEPFSLAMEIFNSTNTSGYVIINDSAVLYRIKNQHKDTKKLEYLDWTRNTLLLKNAIVNDFIVSYLRSKYEIRKYI